MSSRRAAFGGQLTNEDVPLPSGSTSAPLSSNLNGSIVAASAPPGLSPKGNRQSQSTNRQAAPKKVPHHRATQIHSPAKGQNLASGSASGSGLGSARQPQQRRVVDSQKGVTSTSLPKAISPQKAAGAAAASTSNTVRTASAVEKVAATSKLEEGSEPVEVCFICAETATYWAVGECGHRTCHTCAIRLRALYKKNECTFCKTPLARVVFTVSSTQPYSAFPPSSTPFSDTKLGIAFETREQMEDSLSLLRFNCPYCDSVLLGWADLKRHTRKDHGMMLCDLCCSNKKIFAHEHTLYTKETMKEHVAGEHATCEFCRMTFYDSDLLYAHCRDRHEECFICVRRGIRHEYHLNYDRLEAHFKSAHYLCPYADCLAQKFIVFDSELDLQAHAVATHNAAVSGDQRTRKDARRIETNFSYEDEAATGRNSSTTHGRAGRSGGGGGRRGDRAVAVAAFVHTIDAPHRNRIVPGLGRGNFNGSLSVDPGSMSGLTQSHDNEHGSGSNTSSETLKKHAELMKKVADSVTSETKVTSFKSAVRGYRGNEMSADDLVDQLWNIFDHEKDTIDPIVAGLEQLLDDPEKASQLAVAWRDKSDEQTQFPSLAPIGPTLHGLPTSALSNASSSRRALQSTQPRNQGAPGIWARVESAASHSASPSLSRPSNSGVSRSQAFPPLNAVPGSVARVAVRHTPWASGSVSGGSRPSSRAGTPTMTNGGGGGGTSTTSPPPSASVAAHGRGAASFVSATSAPPPRTMVVPRTSNREAFPSLPSSAAEAERRARVRAALDRPNRTILDVSPGQDALSSVWGGGSMPALGGYGASRSGASTRSGTPEPPLYSTGGAGVAQTSSHKKKKKEKVIIMSAGLMRG